MPTRSQPSSNQITSGATGTLKASSLTTFILTIWLILFSAQGSTFTLTTLASFHGTNGANPSSGLLQTQDGSFYGTTIGGGTFNLGTVFKMSPNGLLTNLTSFNRTNGANPKAALAQVANDAFYFYGTTSSGGASNLGTIFKITTNGAHTVMVSFSGTNGANPQASLILSKDGNFCGTTYYGGTNSWPNGYGTFFQMTTNGVLTNQLSFDNTNGAEPFASLIQSADGNFYGTTQVGGSAGYGTVFKMTSNGLLTNLASFNGANGAFPLGRLVQASDGNLYGTTFGGGASNLGSVFRITTNGVVTTLVSFAGTNGANPYAGLLQGSDGNFYGTTEQGYGPGGATDGFGTVFEMTTNGILTTLATFDGTNGAFPLASLVQGMDGSFYGTTANGGADGYGMIFRIGLTASPPPVFQTLTQTGATLGLTWSAVAGRTYQMSYKTNLNQDNWITLGSTLTATSITATLVVNIGPDPQRFYRVALLP
jgi:uncharacterized repeat protein (TIGR03803 family)